ncbi:MAG: YSC84-related protein [Isosphaeraceae bacterium]|nr:YSC84-related protein [Isosphaeraceae bacterium]
MRRGSALAIGVVVCGMLAGASSARAQSREAETLTRANWVLDEIVAKNKKGLPPAILRKAYAVAIFPNIVKGGFVVGGRFGHGVILVRNGERWSFPIFASLGGGSFGLQAGIQSTDLVLVFKSRESLDSFFEGRDKLTISANGSVALGPLGRHAEAGTGVALKAQYLAYSRNRGLFAGASLAGSGIAVDWRSNGTFYGRTISPAEIIGGKELSIPTHLLPAVDQLRATIVRKSRLGVDDEIVVEPPMDGSEVIIEHDEPVTLDGRPMRSSEPRRRTNTDDRPNAVDDPLDDLPPPPSSTTRPSTSTGSRPSTTSEPAAKTAAKPKWSRPSRPPVDNSDLDFPPVEPPASSKNRPKPSDEPARPRQASNPSTPF